ncbi:hypothetical protein pdam_00022441, partial [Pocillopora damicornis]
YLRIKNDICLYVSHASYASHQESCVLVRVHAPPSDFDRLEYALDTGVKVLSFYETLFGEPFPLPKLDLLAVPDFLNGAMEEWGLVVFRRALLVYDEQFTSTDAKVKMTKVIAHELAHQWFGNLVTPRWWNDLWLNEGFAVFVEDEFGANYVMNGWDMRETVVSTSWKSALHGDSMWSSHPISVEVQKPEEIDDIFDAISYQKGAMILRMLMNYLGVEKFLNGIKGYLETYKYGNADAEELWDAIGEASGDINVKKMMRVWTDQKGFPIVSIRRKGRVFHIEQEDVLDKLMKDKKQAQNRKRWYLPISYFTESDPTVRWVTIPPHTQSYPLTTVSISGWIMANINATGFFMVNYDEENWKKLAVQLRKDHQVFTPNDRAGLIHDVFTLACQGLLDPVLALNLSTYLVQENHPVPWALARGKSKCLMGLLSKAHKLLYKNYLWSLQDHLIDLVGMEDTGNDLERFFRYDVLSEAMRSDQRKEIRERFIRLFNELKETPLGSLPSVGPNFRYLAFSFGVNKSSEEDWHYLWSVYQQSPFDTDRKFLMRVITSFNTENIRSRNLLFSLDENRVRPQDSLFWIEMMGKGRGKMDDRWEFILKHWKTLARRYAGSYKFGNLIKAVKKTFQSLTPGEIAVRAQSQTVEKIQHNIAGNPAHLKTSEKRIVRWLKDYKRIS